MNTEEKLVPSSIAEIIEKTSESLRQFAIKETQWLIEKNNYENRIAELEGQLKAHENINIDLLKRIKMLEYSLNTERSDETKERERRKLDHKQHLLTNCEIANISENSKRPSILTLFKEIGVDENLANNLLIDLELHRTELESLVRDNTRKEIEQMSPEPRIKVKHNATKVNNIATVKAPKEEDKQSQKMQSGSKLKSILHTDKDLNVSDNLSDTGSLLNSKRSSLNLAGSTFTELKFHLDVIRKISYMPDLGLLASVGEDCLLNIWSVANLSYRSIHADIEPLVTFRSHTGPLFSLETFGDLVYSAGNEGIIKVWKVPKEKDILPFGDVESLFNCNIAYLQRTNEVVWDLKHHKTKPLLCAMCSDGLTYLWKTLTVEDYIDHLAEDKLDILYINSVRHPKEDKILNPVCGGFLSCDDNILAIGYTDGSIGYLDVNRTSFTQSLHEQKKQESQVNSICSAPSVATFYAGYEDGSMRIFDYRTNTAFNPINAHSDAVTSIELLNELYLFSTSHDSRIKMWDVRNMTQSVQENLGSQQKWNEAIWDSAVIQDQMSIATAGADSVIRIYKL